MGDMPYSIDKGQALAAVEDLMNSASDDDAISFVSTWRHKAKQGELVKTISEQLVHPGKKYAGRGSGKRDKRARKYPEWYGPDHHVNGPGALDLHLQEHWYDPDSGFFLGISGDIEGIVGEALCRAFEASMGKDVPAQGPLEPKSKRRRRWPIDMWWVCPAPRFDVGVSWWTDGGSGSAHDGQVRVVFLTPPFKGGVIFQQLDTDPTKIAANDPDYGRYRLTEAQARNYSPTASMATAPLYDLENDGLYAHHSCGSWIVSTQRTTIVTNPVSAQPHGEAQNDVFPHVELSGPITTVSPAFANGGVRPY